MRLHRHFLSLAALALASAAAPPAASAAAVDRTPGITSVSPGFGPAAGGNTVRINTRSVSPAAVTFGGVAASEPTEIVVGDDFENGIAYYSFNVRVPAGAAGSTVEVEVDGRGGVDATSDDYTYTAPHASAPGIERVFGGAKGPVAGGNRVVAHVYGPVKPTAQLWFGDIPGTDAMVEVNRILCPQVIPAPPCPIADPAVTGWIVSAVAPAAAAAGLVDLSVRSGNVMLRGRTSTSDDYRYEAPPAVGPTVTTITGAAVAGVGGLIRVSGTALGGLRSVKIGSRRAIPFLSSANQFYAFAPALPAGEYPVTVTTKAGTTTAPSPLEYRAAP